MLNKKFRILWFKLQREGNMNLCISFPIPLYIFQELIDCILDLLEFVYYIAPNRQNPGSSLSVYTVKEIVRMTINLFDSLTEDEPYDLVDVTANKVKVSIKIG